MESPSRRDIVVVGGSAGGVEALIRLVSLLPSDLMASVLAVIHTAPRDQPGLLATLLGRAGPLPAHFAEDGQSIRRGEILLAPADMHMLIDGDEVRVTHGPRENGFRPAIDPLFRTAARSYGSRVIGVILSGALDDGTHGLQQIKRHGGLALVQHAEEALFSSMPLSALRNVEVDHVLRLDELARKIVEATGHGKRTAATQAADRGARQDTAEEGSRGLQDGSLSWPPSGITCPQCGGALWETREGKLLGFRCHVGHRYAEASLLAHQASEVEAALWTALRALEEAVAVRQRMARHAIEMGLDGLARAYLDGASAAEGKAKQIRRVLVEPEHEPVPPLDVSSATEESAS